MNVYLIQNYVLMDLHLNFYGKNILLNIPIKKYIWEHTCTTWKPGKRLKIFANGILERVSDEKK